MINIELEELKDLNTVLEYEGLDSKKEDIVSYLNHLVKTAPAIFYSESTLAYNIAYSQDYVKKKSTLPENTVINLYNHLVKMTQSLKKLFCFENTSSANLVFIYKDRKIRVYLNELPR